jgi:hypothetical protein
VYQHRGISPQNALRQPSACPRRAISHVTYPPSPSPLVLDKQAKEEIPSMTSRPHASSLCAVSRVVQVAGKQSIATTHYPIGPCPPTVGDSRGSQKSCLKLPSQHMKHVVRSLGRQNSWLDQSLKRFIGWSDTTCGLEHFLVAYVSHDACTRTEGP